MNYFAIPGVKKPNQKPKELLFVHPERIKAAVMMFYDKPWEFFWLRSRIFEDCYPRQVLIWLLKKYTNLRYRQILEMIGREGHCDVIYACRQVENYIATDPKIKNEIKSIVEIF